MLAGVVDIERKSGDGSCALSKVFYGKGLLSFSTARKLEKKRGVD